MSARDDVSQRGACSGGLERGSPACWRKFGTSGHFEHLLRMDKKTGAAEDDEEDSKPNKDTRYWYAPFLLADLSSASMKDFVPLPVRNVSDESGTPAILPLALVLNLKRAA